MNTSPLASTLFGLPGDFSGRTAVKAFLLRLRSLRLYGLWIGYKDMRRYLAERSLPPPRELLEKLVRRTRAALKGKQAG